MYTIKLDDTKELQKLLAERGEFVDVLGESAFMADSFESEDMRYFDECLSKEEIQKCIQAIRDADRGMPSMLALEMQGLMRCKPTIVENTNLCIGFRTYIKYSLNDHDFVADPRIGDWVTDRPDKPIPGQIIRELDKAAIHDVFKKSAKNLLFNLSLLLILAENHVGPKILQSTSYDTLNRFLHNSANKAGFEFEGNCDEVLLDVNSVYEKDYVKVPNWRYKAAIGRRGMISLDTNGLCVTTFDGNLYDSYDWSLPESVLKFSKELNHEMRVELYSACAVILLYLSGFRVSGINFTPVETPMLELPIIDSIQRQIITFSDLKSFVDESLRKSL